MFPVTPNIHKDDQENGTTMIIASFPGLHPASQHLQYASIRKLDEDIGTRVYTIV